MGTDRTLPEDENHRPVYKDYPPFIVLTPDEGQRWHADDALRAEVFAQVVSLGGFAQIGYGAGALIDVVNCAGCRSTAPKTRDGRHHPGFEGKRFYKCRASV